MIGAPLPAPSSAAIHGSALASWLPFYQPRPQAALRLLCFPHAGGTALNYREWLHGLPADIEVCPLQLPGRGTRFHEPAFTRVQAMLDALLPVLEPLLDRPLALFGHSMGAALGFALGVELEARGTQVLRLFASGRRPPLPGPAGSLHRQSDEELTDYLRRLGGTPDIVFEDAELKATIYRLLRADLELNDHYASRQRLRAPISVLGGHDDPLVSPATLSGWTGLTTASCDFTSFEGDHFFLQPQRAGVLRLLAGTLAGDLEKMRARPSGRPAGPSLHPVAVTRDSRP